MRLIEFRPRGYRNLRDLPLIFTLDPDARNDLRCSVRFLVGVNGTGKSNILRFLTAIFAALDEDYRFPRPGNPAYNARFRLVYEVGNSTITLRSTGQGRAGLRVNVAGDPREYADGELPGNDLMLPQTVLIYSSGDVAAWRDLLYIPPELTAPNAPERTEDEDDLPTTIDPDAENVPQQWIATGIVPPDALPDADGETVPEPEGYRTGEERIWLVEGSHLRLALLAAFLGDVAGAKEADRVQWAAVLAQVQIEEMIAFSLRLMFDPARISTRQQRTLDMLRDAATTRLDQFGTQLWVYDINKSVDDQTPPARLLNPREGDTMQAFQLFRALVELSDAGLLRDVHVVLMRNEKTGEDDTRRRVTLASSLSDGERAYLERMALIALFRSRECLFLLDEPETHFNDTWKRGLVNQIEQALKETNSMVVLTTHESVTLTDALPEEVILLSERGQENVPLTLGTEPGELLRAVFGAPASVGERALQRIGDDINRARQTQDDTILRDLLTKVGTGYQRYRIAEALVGRDEDDDVS